jgi:hypothetical protein
MYWDPLFIFPELTVYLVNYGMQSFTYAEYLSLAIAKVWAGKADLPSTTERGHPTSLPEAVSLPKVSFTIVSDEISKLPAGVKNKAAIPFWWPHCSLCILHCG